MPVHLALIKHGYADCTSEQLAKAQKITVMAWFWHGHQNNRKWELSGNAKVAVASYQGAKHPETAPFVEEVNEYTCTSKHK